MEGTREQYDLINKIWKFLKQFGTPETNDEYWHKAMNYARENFTTEQEADAILYVLNRLDKEIKENGN